MASYKDIPVFQAYCNVVAYSAPQEAFEVSVGKEMVPVFWNTCKSVFGSEPYSVFFVLNKSWYNITMQAIVYIRIQYKFSWLGIVTVYPVYSASENAKPDVAMTVFQ